MPIEQETALGSGIKIVSDEIQSKMSPPGSKPINQKNFVDKLKDVVKVVAEELMH